MGFKKKSIKLLLHSLILSLILAGCAGNSGSNEGVTKKDTNDDSLKIHYLSSRQLSDGVLQTMMDIADQYKEINPNFEFEVESISDRQAYLQKVKILAASNELPDWFDADPEPFFEEIAKKGVVANIEDMYNELDVTDKFFKISLDYPRLADNSLYLMTFTANTEYFWYNKDLFQQANVSVPKTIDELLEVSKKLKEAGITPIAIHGKDTWPLLRYMAFIPFRLEGNDYLDKLRKGEISMEDEAGIKAAEFIQTLGQNYFNEGWANADFNTSLELFKNGEAAMYYMGTWQVKDMIDENMNLKENIGYFKMPSYTSTDVTGESDYFANSGIGTAILKDSMNDEMKNFLKFLFEKYADTSLYTYNTIPSIQPKVKEDELPQIYQDIIKDASEVDTYAKVWDVQLDPETNEVMGREITNLALGLLTPQEFAKRIDEALERNVPKYFD